MMLLYASVCFTVVLQHSHKVRMKVTGMCWSLIFHTAPQSLHHIIPSQSSHIVCLKPRVPQNHPLSPQAKRGLYWLFFYWNPNLKDSPCEQRVTRAIHCDVFTAQNARVARLIQYRGPCIARCSGAAVSKQPPKWGFDVI